MRRVAVEMLEPGDRLGRDVHANPDAPPLLRAGVRVSEGYRRSLQRAGIVAVWVDDTMSAGIEPLEILEEPTRRRAAAAIHEAFRRVTLAPPGDGELPADVVEEMSEVAELIIHDITRNVHSALALNDLATADGYTLKHSLAVTTLGLSLGLRVMRKYGWIDACGRRRFDDLESRLSPLGVGLLLHDIGKLAVPPEILRKPGPLTEDEWQAMRTHPMHGVRILHKADDISPLARAVVRSHHERWDGSGYPDGKAGADIHQFARIAAVADVFDALTSDRCYRQAAAPRYGYDFVVAGAGQHFDPEVVEIFQSVVAPYPPGTCVVLSDGSIGLVTDVRPGAVRQPVVRVIADPSGVPVPPWEIDLSRVRDITIVSVNTDRIACAREGDGLPRRPAA
jgi:HD-GYP domain-containing protein (c-di-GMP phosphodiesterase class II)